ncbi:MAG: DUF697 domain-containing protein [Gaiellales bacterium]
MPRLPLHPGAVWGIVKEVKAAAEDFRPLLIGGAPEPARKLREALVADGDEQAVRDVSGRDVSPYDLEGAALLLWCVEGERPSEEDEHVFRLADRKDVAAICILVGAGAGAVADIPYVLATDVIRVPSGAEIPLDIVAERIAERADEKGYSLAAKLPVLRPAVCESIVRRFSRQNGILGAAIFIPGADFPVLTLNQVRMVFRIAAAYGEEIDRERAVELLGVVGAGLGFRAVARQALGVVPVAGWAVKGGIAYAATRALGEAAIAYFEHGGTRGLVERVGSVRSGS